MEMATVGVIERHGTFGIKVTVDSDRGNKPGTYFKIYDSNDYHSAKHCLRINFKSNTYFYHRGFPRVWNPSHVPFDDINKWLKEKSKYEPTLSNWQYAIFQWDRECGYYISIEDFISGKSDIEYGDNPRYVLSTQKMPDYNSNMTRG